MTSLDEIRTRFAEMEKAAERFREAWPHLSTATCTELYVQDVGYLLGLFTILPADAPPSDDRDVLVHLRDGDSLVGFRRGGIWSVYDVRWGLDVIGWQELPPRGERLK